MLAEERLQMVGFRLGKEEYALDILNIQEIIRSTEITTVPSSPKTIEGVINLRGRILPVMDLRTVFGREPMEKTKSTRIIVANLGAKTIGFMVDEVSEVLALDTRKIEEAPKEVIGKRDYVRGVCKVGPRLLLLLDVDRLMSVKDEQTEAVTA